MAPARNIKLAVRNVRNFHFLFLFICLSEPILSCSSCLLKIFRIVIWPSFPSRYKQLKFKKRLLYPFLHPDSVSILSLTFFALLLCCSPNPTSSDLCPLSASIPDNSLSVELKDCGRREQKRDYTVRLVDRRSNT